jgi:predicted dehydrogenase
VKRVKIVGAGSIGTHHAHACRRLGWDVTVVDVDQSALERMRTSLFPSRYGGWDAQIRLAMPSEVPRGPFDLVIVGTPPDSHVRLSLEALDDSPAALLIEKPLAPPYSADVDVLLERGRDSGTRLFVGYDHVVGRAAQMVASEVAGGAVGQVLTIDVEFREHWAGIFRAHPWLTGPEDSYLGFWRRGGGAASEHSHAANLWQYLARISGAGRVVQVQAALDYVSDGGAVYDRLCLLSLRAESGLLGRVVQDVVTRPPRKMARIQGDRGAIEWHAGYRPDADAVVVKRADDAEEVRLIAKTRPDDFIEELRHIELCCGRGEPSPIDLAWGVETVRLITAAHESERLGRAVTIAGRPADQTAEARH